MANRLLAQRGRSGAHALFVKSASDDSIFQIEEEEAQAGVRGKFIPRWLGAPWGGRMGRGCERQALSSRRANGAYRTRPWAGRGAASSEQATSKQEGKWLGAPWGAHGQGVRTASPYRPVGRKGLTGCAPGWGGGKLQQVRLLCPRITGAKGVNLVDMRY